MANLPEDKSAWIDGIYQLEVTDPVQGGPGGVDNEQATQLGNRTAWLKDRVFAALRMEDIKPISGTYNVIVDDIGQVLSVHDPSAAIINLPALASFPKGQPLCIVISNPGTGGIVPLNANGAEIIENFLNSGDGITSYTLDQGTRLVLVATETSWVIVLKTAPVVFPSVSGYAVGDVAFNFGPVAARPGFLLANGALISRTTYADLFAVYGTTYGAGDGVTTFKLPDPRDLFPRIFNGGNGLDPARAFGSTQQDALKDHTHNYNERVFGGGEFPNTTGADHSQSDQLFTTTNIVGPDSGGLETRPKNITINAYIKY